MYKPEPLNSHSGTTLAFMVALILVPGFVNDLIYIDGVNYQTWLAFDYGLRIALLAIIIGYRPFRDVISSALFANRVTLKGILGAAFCVILMLTFSFISNVLFYDLLGGDSSVLFNFPLIEHDGIRIFDLTVGLALVAISEELIYRGIMVAWLRRYASSTFVLLVLPAIVFAFIHWSLGPVSVISAFIDGIILMILYLRTRSLLPPILAHYAVNLIIFL